MLFYVADGGAEDLPELLEWLDWGGVRLDLTAVGAGELADPPVRWLHPATVPMQRPGAPPGLATAGDGADPGNLDGSQVPPEGGTRRSAYPTPGLPEPPELIALLATLAAACHRLAVAAAR